MPRNNRRFLPDQVWHIKHCCHKKEFLLNFACDRFEDQCTGNVTADYKQLDDGVIEVVNRCLDAGGMIDMD